MALRFGTGLRNALNGGNLVTNGKFTSATTSWTDTDCAIASVASGQEGNCLRLTEDGVGTVGDAYQSITVKSGMTYFFEAYAKLGTCDTVTIEIGTAEGDATYYTSGAVTPATWTRYVGAFTAAGTTAVITLNTSGDSDTAFFDEIRLTPVPSLKDIFRAGTIEIRTGTQPTEPDDVPSGTLLVTIQYGSSGITWDDSASGVLTKADAETWNGTCVATGTAGWFRLLSVGDLGTDNTGDYRIDGSVATSGGQLNMSSTSFITGATETITEFSITLPMAQ